MIRKLGLALGALAAALALAELVVRVLGLGTPAPGVSLDQHTASRLESGVFVFDRDLLWREPSGPPDEIHRHGHFVRVGDTLPAPDGRLRLLVLGDSCPRLSRGNAPWSVRLEQILGPDRVVVRNASLPGYTTWQGLAWLREHLLDWSPDLVVVSFGWNDHWRAAAWEDKDWPEVLDGSPLRLLNLVRRPPRGHPLRVAPDDYRANLAELTRLVASRSGRTVVVLPPSDIDALNTARFLENRNIRPGDDPADLHARYLEIARELAGTGDRDGTGVGGLQDADAAAWFAAVGEPRLLLEADGIHYTEAGHELMARLLAPLLAGAEQPDPAAVGLGIVAQEAAATGRYAEARRLYGRAVAAAPDDVGLALSCAWLLSTCPDAAVRDGAAALAVLAAVADSAAGFAGYHDVRGAALATAGRFDEAVGAVDQALALAAAVAAGDGAPGGPGAGFTAQLEARRALYAAGRAYRVEARGGGGR
ncbi:MAG: GDSL-type esterase/lipase family protein [Candidatus Krumholzibacteriia bacterium]